jgi:hypothetical protein
VRVLLLQLDGKIPNVALMRVAAHHAGDDVTLRRVGNIRALQPELWDAPDLVYASVVFERNQALGEEVKTIYPSAQIGGTGWDVNLRLEDVGITTLDQDYSIYPRFKPSIGFTQRGCRFRCPFCVVPKKEGRVTEVQTISEIWRGDPHPRDIVLLDNDFFGQRSWPARIEELRQGDFRVSFNQGINARTLTDESAAALASVRYYDGHFKRRCIYTAWDNRKDEKRVFHGLEALVRHGVKPHHIMVYMLIAYWPDETVDDWLYRQRRLREFGAKPYPMPYVRNPETIGFQRWVVRAADQFVPWEDWVKGGYDPRKVPGSGFAVCEPGPRAI